MSVRLRTILLLVVAMVLTAGATAYATTTLRAGAAEDQPVVRTVLAEDENPAGAPGRTLALSRVTVDPGAELALHRHPGTQIATIARGTLTYWVVRGGPVEVHRGDRLVRKVKAGERTRVQTGEWMVEPPGTIHHAANQGRAEIEILLSTLFRNGAPPAIAVRP
ncbi:cupin domain-containing protein [Conexibacter sp. CPCC 206217]|uniref:cupin domain-containing protein n=1 Tax=Conexibacter sp. CPCC 206217 TaxID=3064574 RepID=UPI00271C9702|nr:cupin domain-containing protein [Conexibacter sp. CPCC 206217]MDO8213947.1 cupin domain-containing protein [Conexibacter sp. CPCC 206217]